MIKCKCVQVPIKLSNFFHVNVRSEFQKFKFQLHQPKSVVRYIKNPKYAISFIQENWTPLSRKQKNCSKILNNTTLNKCKTLPMPGSVSMMIFSRFLATNPSVKLPEIDILFCVVDSTKWWNFEKCKIFCANNSW